MFRCIGVLLGSHVQKHQKARERSRGLLHSKDSPLPHGALQPSCVYDLFYGVPLRFLPSMAISVKQSFTFGHACSEASLPSIQQTLPASQRQRQRKTNITKRRGRPLTTTKSKRVNGYHIYVGEQQRDMAARRRKESFQALSSSEIRDKLDAGTKAWKDERPETKQICHIIARRFNRQHRIAFRIRLANTAVSIDNSRADGRLGIGDQQWPLAKHRLVSAGYGTKSNFVHEKFRMEPMWGSSDAQA